MLDGRHASHGSTLDDVQIRRLARGSRLTKGTVMLAATLGASTSLTCTGKDRPSVDRLNPSPKISLCCASVGPGPWFLSSRDESHVSICVDASVHLLWYFWHETALVSVGTQGQVHTVQTVKNRVGSSSLPCISNFAAVQMDVSICCGVSWKRRFALPWTLRLRQTCGQSTTHVPFWSKVLHGSRLLTV